MSASCFYTLRSGQTKNTDTGDTDLTDAVDSSNGFRLSTSREQKFGRLEQVKQEESTDKHEESDRSNGDVQVSPPHVDGFVAAWLTCRSDVAGTKGFVTFVVGQEAPGNYISLAFGTLL